MKPPLEQLIQRLEQITQQLKILEAVFSTTAKTRSHSLLADWKNSISMKTDPVHAYTPEELLDRAFQAEQDSFED